MPQTKGFIVIKTISLPHRFLLTVATLAFAGSALAHGEQKAAKPNAEIIAKLSPHSVVETIDRLEKVAKSKGLTIFARIDHAGEAEKAGLKMRPTILLILGHPKSGTPLMQAAPTIAIDLPLKALAWQDTDGKVWIGYNSPTHLQKRHQLSDDMAKVLGGIGGLIDAALQ
jgi:uncharacterized protein (DUF302 family)